MAVFTNTTLEGYFKDIANATRSLCELSGTLTLKQIHDALLSKADLTRNTTPKTPGDYLKGIAVCARKINGRSDYLTATSTLAEILHCVKNPASSASDSESTVTKYGITVTFKNNGDLTVSSDSLEIDYCNTYFYDQYWNEIYSGQQFEYRNYATELSAQGYVRAQVEVVTMSGDMLSIETGFINFP